MSITIEVDSKTVQEALTQLVGQLSDMTPAMRNIAGALADGIEQNFDDERDPVTGTPWQRLSNVTIGIREKSGHWPGKNCKYPATSRRASRLDSGLISRWPAPTWSTPPRSNSVPARDNSGKPAVARRSRGVISRLAHSLDSQRTTKKKCCGSSTSTCRLRSGKHSTRTSPGWLRQGMDDPSDRVHRDGQPVDNQKTLPTACPRPLPTSPTPSRCYYC